MNKLTHTVGQNDSKAVSKPGQSKNAAGYSATPLSKKLGIKPGQEVWLVNAPEDYLEWLQPLPDGVMFKKRQSRNTGMAHLFMTRQVALQNKLQQLMQSLDPRIPVWISWPKKSSGVSSTVTEDTIRQAALPLGYVDIKVCAVSAVWSGLKLVVRKELR